jgi:hypothetical protein
MEIKLLAPDKETLERMLNGCQHYGLKARHNKRTKPYVHVEVNTEEDVVNIFWLGANLARPKIETRMTESVY